MTGWYSGNAAASGESCSRTTKKYSTGKAMPALTPRINGTHGCRRTVDTTRIIANNSGGTHEPKA